MNIVFVISTVFYVAIADIDNGKHVYMLKGTAPAERDGEMYMREHLVSLETDKVYKEGSRVFMSLKVECQDIGSTSDYGMPYTYRICNSLGGSQ